MEGSVDHHVCPVGFPGFALLFSFFAYHRYADNDIAQQWRNLNFIGYVEGA